MSAARFETTERAKPRLLISIVEVSPEFRKALAALSNTNCAQPWIPKQDWPSLL